MDYLVTAPDSDPASDRIQRFVAGTLNNPRFGSGSPAGLQKPFLVALGQTAAYYSEDLWLFNKAVTNAVFLQLRGADHFIPCDIGWTRQLPKGRGPTIAYNACALWFFDTYLKGEAPRFQLIRRSTT